MRVRESGGERNGWRERGREGEGEEWMEGERERGKEGHALRAYLQIKHECRINGSLLFEHDVRST